MAAPKYDIIQTDYQNPHASGSLKLNMVVVSNTPEDKIVKNIRENSRKYKNWLNVKDAHDGVAVFIGGGASINDHIADIKALNGATIITMNGSAKWARENGIKPTWQVIVDAKKETAAFVDGDCKNFLASQCAPKTLDKANDVTLVHIGSEAIEGLFPDERVKAGGYTLLGGGATVGLAALSIAFSQGFREMHIFGYDSSYVDGQSHGYEQTMNRFMPTTNITWGGKTFTASVAMKGQAEKFPLNARALKNAGCDLHVYGEGLLQTIYTTKYEKMEEREKYQLMWNIPDYRTISPGEYVVDTFLNVAKPEGTIIDFGCGTGRASVKIAETNEVILVDFTDNCRDQEALCLPFIQSDLTNEIPVSAPYGFCTDVMEHIRPIDVERVLRNIRQAVKSTFFQISLIDDNCGTLIGQPLHLSVHPFGWWETKFKLLGFEINWSKDQGNAALFYVTREY